VPVETKPTPKPVETKPTPKPVETKPTPKPVETKPTPKPEPPTDWFAFGVPEGLKPGLPDAYWIYQDAEGWHLRTTSRSQPPLAHFQGTIRITDGKFSNVQKVGMEGNDRIESAAQNIEVDYETMGHWDGIDFGLSGTKCLHFDLRVDAKYQPKLIFVGAKKVNPPAAKFTICL
jgi:hypothetical protein